MSPCNAYGISFPHPLLPFFLAKSPLEKEGGLTTGAAIPKQMTGHQPSPPFLAPNPLCLYWPGWQPVARGGGGENGVFFRAVTKKLGNLLGAICAPPLAPPPSVN